ncbi:unnamed protein product [Discosporangium mesarthrocarpum]
MCDCSTHSFMYAAKDGGACVIPDPVALMKKVQGNIEGIGNFTFRLQKTAARRGVAVSRTFAMIVLGLGLAAPSPLCTLPKMEVCAPKAWSGYGPSAKNVTQASYSCGR